jgi:hypothetical protein
MAVSCKGAPMMEERRFVWYHRGIDWEKGGEYERGSRGRVTSLSG